MNNETEQIFLVNSSENQPAVVAQKSSILPGTPQVNLENVEDFSTVCRTCATITELVVPIFDGMQNNLAEKIHRHLPIQVSETDALPRVVCYQCASTLLAWHELVQCCVQADQALKARLAQLNRPQRDNIRPRVEESKLQDVGKDEKNKSDPSVNFNEMVKNIIVNYLNSINMDVTNADLVYVCENCPERPSYADVTSLADHMQDTHRLEVSNCKDTEMFVKSNIAFEELLITDESDREMEIHAESKTEVVPNFFCPFCKSMFSSTTRLMCHLNRHIEVNIDKGMPCCGTTYHSKQTFVAHLQENHASQAITETLNLCRSCGYQASDNKDLQLHVSQHHDNQKKCEKKKKEMSTKNQKCIPAVCLECNKTFSNKYNMFVHMKSHSSEKRTFSCDQCGKCYSNQGNLTAHKRIVHDGVLKHVCRGCGEAFPTALERDVHSRLHTGDKPFQCPHCVKSYRAKNTLDRHIDMHLDIRKYECHICPKKFRKRTHLNYHISTHRKGT